MANNRHHHFLIVTVEAQGHINPSRHLARRLVRCASGAARVTVAIPTSGYHRMFPNSAADNEDDADEPGLVSFAHYPTNHGLDPNFDLPKIKTQIKEGVARIASDLSSRGRPVTCIIYALFLSMAADVARDLGVPSVLFWIQPAAVFAIYRSYYHQGFPIKAPGLPPLDTRDLPSFITAPPSSEDGLGPYSFVGNLLEDVFKNLEREVAEAAAAEGGKPKVLVNTFQELEADVLGHVDFAELFPVGPLASEARGDLFEESGGYIEWLESKPEKSVVYVSFGSISKLSRRQKDEIVRGLAESGRPYLWVVRRDNREDEGTLLELGQEAAGNLVQGKVVEWCSQMRVLSCKSVGCFVTHCGWNSTLESMACGVPTVMVPQWTDQGTNAKLAEALWGTGVRGEVDADGVLEAAELRRCLDVVMGEGKRAAEIRRRAETWREKAREAVAEGGSSDRNLKAFLEKI